eukprot:5080097-Ditylum_brightwellii.AAC.1
MDLHCASIPLGLLPGIYLGCLPQGIPPKDSSLTGGPPSRGDWQSTSTGVHLRSSPTGGTVILHVLGCPGCTGPSTYKNVVN